MKDDMVGMGVIVVLGFLAIVPIAAVLNGYVVVTLWRWFIVPQFGAAPLAFTSGIGIALLAHFLTHQRTKISGDNLTDAFVWLFFHPLFTLGIGWIVVAVAR